MGTGRETEPMPGAPKGVGVSLQERIEESALGKVVISGFILFILGALLVSNLPASELKRTADPMFRAALGATGLRQSWNLFAPKPRWTTEQLEARLTYGDGTTILWRPPTSDPVIGAYRAYRFRKWMHNVLGNNRVLWQPAAEWIARNHQRNGEWPREVALVKKTFIAPPPGSGRTERPDWEERTFFVARFEPNGS